MGVWFESVLHETALPVQRMRAAKTLQERSILPATPNHYLPRIRFGLLLLLFSLTQCLAQIPDGFNPGPNARVQALAIQTDGKILVGGLFTVISGGRQPYLCRLNPDGGLDTNFNVVASASSVSYLPSFSSIIIQSDDQIVVAGLFDRLNSQGAKSVGRLDSNGNVDPTFSTNAANGFVWTVLSQPDGKIIVGGDFLPRGLGSPYYLERLNPNGSIDTNFLAKITLPPFPPRPAGPNSGVNCLALQSDGKILAGGKFTTFGTQSCNHLVRLNSDGTLENAFRAGADGAVFCLAIQPDGKILVGGTFTNLLGAQRGFLARLNPDATLDGQFAPGPNAPIESIAIQSNGKIVVGGLFTAIAGQPQSCLARLNSDGTLDTSFTNLFFPAPGTGVYALGLESDGNLLVSGLFTNVAGLSRNNLARLSSASSVMDQLTFDGSTISWFRNGIGPEFSSLSFDGSTNGIDWISLGIGVRITDGWQIAGLSLPTNSTIRGRGLVSGGFLNASSWHLDAAIGQPAITVEPASRTNLPATTASFNVTAVGSDLFTYQWLKNGAPLITSANVLGAKASNLTMSNVFGSDAGEYSVAIGNSFGSITSQVAVLTVLDPLVAVQPSSISTRAGQSVSFSLTATGTQPIQYQWRRDGSPIPGATATALALTNVQPVDAAHYDVLVSNVFGSTTSAVAVLTVNQVTLDGFNPSPDGNIFASAFQEDGKLLVAGSFSTLGARTCINLGRFNVDGTPDSAFNPNPNGTVSTIAVQSDGKILVAGIFGSLGGGVCNNFGRLNTDGTLDRSFSSSIGGINAIAVQPDGKILLGGSFQAVNNAFVSSVCRLTPAGGLDGTFKTTSTVNGAVHALALQPDGGILLGGVFTKLWGTNRLGIARLNSDGSLDLSFNPGSTNSVDCITLQPDGKILVAGAFTFLAGQPRNHMARLNPDGTLDTAFNPSANDTILSMTLQANGDILVGGQFTTLGTATRKYLGRLYPDGSVDPIFDPGAGSSVYSLALQTDGKLIVGGSFTTLAGQPRAYLGGLNATEPANQLLTVQNTTVTWLRGGSGPEVTSTSFDISTNGTNFYSLGPGLRIAGGWQMISPSLASNATLRIRGFYAGGHFNGSGWTSEIAIGPPVITQSPVSLLGNAASSAAFNVTASGSPPLFYQWRRNAQVLPGETSDTLVLTNIQWSDNGNRYDVIVSNSFGLVLSAQAMLTVNLAVPDLLNPAANTAVRSIAIQADGKILLGGDFTALGAQAKSRLARLNPDGSVDTSFGGSADNSVSWLAVREDNRIYVGGNFSTLAGQPRAYLGRLNANGSPDAFDPVLNGGVMSLALDGAGNLIVGTIGYNNASVLRFMADDTLDPSFNVAVNSFASPFVSDLLVQPDGQIVVAGVFDSLAGQSYSGFARLQSTGRIDPSLRASFGGGQVISIAPQADGKLLLGGDFNSVNGLAREHIARLNADGSLDPDFNPGADGQVSAIAVQSNGRILVGGWFTTLDGRQRPYLGRLNQDGSLDETFYPAPDTGVFAIAVQADGKILAGGYFTKIGGQNRGCIARLPNTDSVNESMAFDGSTITWLRGGGGPEIWRSSFELSADGTNWIMLGSGTRFDGGWQLGGISITQPSFLRARGFIPTGCGAAGGWFVQRTIFVTPPIIVTDAANFGLRSNQFGFDFTGYFGQSVAVEWSTNLFDWNTSTTNIFGTNRLHFSDPLSLDGPARFYRLRTSRP